MKTFKKVIERLLLLFWNTFFNRIPSNTIRRLTLRALGAKLARNSVILRKTDVIAPKGLSIERSSSIGSHSLIDSRGRITIGSNVTVASYCRLVTAKHDIEDPQFHAEYLPIVIEDYAWICTGATIIGGVTIGHGAVVMAGAVVTKDVLPMTVVGGVPARRIKDRKTEPTFEDNMRWAFLN